jgi:tetratricopeptide (TPR) repeat protein
MRRTWSASKAVAAIVPLLLLFTPSAVHALVIGNASYKYAPALGNPKNDASDVAAALSRFGFQVIAGLDLDKTALERKVREFSIALQGTEVGLFFYAGHGLQVSGQNYVVPTDAQLATLAYTKAAQGDLPEAQRSYGARVEIANRLAANDDPEWRRKLAVSYDDMGDTQRKRGDLDGALKSYQAAHAIFVELAKADSRNLSWQHDLAVSYQKVGDTQVLQNNLTAGLQSFSESLAIVERLERSDPNSVRIQDDLSSLYERIGDIHNAQGDLSGAVAAYKRDVAITQRLARLEPADAGRQHDLAISHRTLASAYIKQWNMMSARQEVNAARAVLAQLVAASPDRSDWKSELAQLDEALEKLPK